MNESSFSDPFVSPGCSFTFLSFFLWDSLSLTNNAELTQKQNKNKTTGYEGMVNLQTVHNECATHASLQSRLVIT